MSSEFLNDDSEAEVPTPAATAAQRAGLIVDTSADDLDESALSSPAWQDLADQLWLHSLLTQLLQPAQAAQREALIQRVMAHIPNHSEVVTGPAPAGTSPKPRRRSWLVTVVSVAALLLIGVFLFAPQAGPKTALAAVERSLQAAAEDVDREYQIQMTREDGIKRPPIQLSVRGDQNFVWEQLLPHGTLRVGANSRDVWIVPVLGPVVVAPRGDFERLFLLKQPTTPVLTLSTALEWMRDRYDLELLPKESLPEADESQQTVRCVHYRGKLRERTGWLQPETMEIWSHAETGVVQRAVMSWPGILPSGVNRAELRLKRPSRQLPVDWFEHAAHHDGHRVVIAPPPGEFQVPDEAGAPPQQ